MFPAKRLKATEEWSTDTETGRYLRSTIPFDTHKAILFLSEGSRHVSRKHDSTSGEKNIPSEQLNGEQAKGFYEEILSLPEENRRRTIDKGRTPKRKRIKRNCSERDDPSAHPSTSHNQLFTYAQSNQLDLLKSALTRQNYDINICDDFQWTLVMSAAYAGHMTIVEYLLEKGAEWRRHTDRRGMNAADLARTGGHHRIAEFIENFDRKEGDSVVKTKGGTTLSQSAKQKPREFYCELCQVALKATTPRSSHDTSTVHLFCCQHSQSSRASYGITEANRGFQMLLRSGWNPEKGLGSEEQGQKFPVKTVLKQDRSGFGVRGGGKARVTHFSANDREAVRFHSERYSTRTDSKTKNKKDIMREKKKDRAWEMRIRTMMNEEDY